MERIALFPGSFDPFTVGHYNVVSKALKVFDRIVIGIGNNSSKQRYFPAGEMIEKISSCYPATSNVQVNLFTGLTADFAKTIKARFLIRGIRGNADFDYERGIAEANRFLAAELETIFFIADAEVSFVSSSIVRDIHRHGRDISKLVPFSP